MKHDLKFNQIRIENTNHCSHSCFFCPREKMTRSKGIMQLNDFKFLINKLRREVGDYKGAVHLHGFGEPLLDPFLPEKIKVVKEVWPESNVTIITTLGLKPGFDYLKKMVDAGLDHLSVSIYGNNREEYKKVHGVDMYPAMMENLAYMRKLRDDGYSLNIKINKIGEDLADVGDVQESYNTAPKDQKTRSSLHNYGAGRQYNSPIHDKARVCSIVKGKRKKILQITWDMNVKPCTFDFNAETVFGNFRTDSLEDIFAGKIYLDFIQAHLDGDLEKYPTCNNCDMGPFIGRSSVDKSLASKMIKSIKALSKWIF